VSAAANEAVADTARGEAAPGAKDTYGQILRSSALIGGAQVVNVANGILRAKAAALLLGPAGFGLMGIYTSIANLAQSVAGMGLSGSGVRQIAAAVGSGDADRIARTAAVLRRTSAVLGVAGAALLAALAVPVSRLTFGSAERAVPVALLSLAVLFKVVSDGQAALVQGLRRIGDVARVAIYGGVLGTLATVALVWALRERGVVAAVVAMAGATLLCSWWYARRAAPVEVELSGADVAREARALLALGLAFMASTLLSMASAYLVRLLLVRQVDLAAAGLYQAGWTVGGLYVGFILQSMGTDFYPRLTAVVHDRAHCNRLVNEQAKVSMLLAGPGVIATITLAPLAVPLLYSSEFAAGVAMLRWICLGATMQVITWPLGFVVVAEGRRGLFFAVELGYAIAHLALAWLLVRVAGADGAGMAFFGSYLFHAAVLYPVVRRLTGFRFTRDNLVTAAAFLALVAVAFTGFLLLPPWPAFALGLAALAASAAFSARALARLVPAERLPAPFRPFLRWAAGRRAGRPGGGA
jgi:PST family polysaccharide transporter